MTKKHCAALFLDLSKAFDLFIIPFCCSDYTALVLIQMSVVGFKATCLKDVRALKLEIPSLSF